MLDLAVIRLSRYGDIIAEESGPSRGWVGLTLRPASRVNRTVNWISLLLIVYRYGH